VGDLRSPRYKDEIAVNTRIETWSVDVTANTAPLRAALTDMSRLGDQFASKLVNAFEAVAIRGKKLEDVVKSLALSLSEMALKAALKPIESALGNAFSGAFGGLAQAAAPALPIPFAQGGVIASPVAFPLSRGRTGIAGERGAEAIMPLMRGPDGKLGVAASGSGRAVNITFNIATPDAASFRRSEAQIGAMLSRTLGAGERNL
jgi:phage-related minor tail protein